MNEHNDDDDVTVIESMCPKCQENGETRLLPHKIPFFRTVLISSFVCANCNYRNNGVEPLSSLQEKGEIIEISVKSISDLDRQVVLSDQACVKIPEFEFEIPKTRLGGLSSTIQGIVLRAADDLMSSQKDRYLNSPEIAIQVEEFIIKLKDLVTPNSQISKNFTLIIDDPSGNSFIENLLAPNPDPQIKSVKYDRTIEQLHQMGFYEELSEHPAAALPGDATTTAPTPRGADLPEEQKSAKVWDLNIGLSTTDLSNATAKFIIPCCHCGKDGSQNMCEIDVPGFRKCWVMAFVCEFCGAKSNEVKVAGSYGAQGKEWRLEVECDLDINRDVLKSDTASIKIPSLDLELEPGTLGGVFTTVEGLLTKIAEEIDEKMPFHGDSQLAEKRIRIENVVSELKAMAAGQRYPFTIILDDLADLSHIGRRDDEILFLTKSTNPKTNETEKHLKTTLYDRSHEQNDFLGLNDMKVENY